MLTEKQIIERRSYIGGSDVAAILSVSPWMTPFMLYQSKIGNLTDKADTSPGSPIDRGNQCEDKICEFYANESGYRLLNSTDSALTFYHEEYDFLHANVDSKVAYRNLLVECKTSSNRKHWGRPGTNEIPIYYLTQVAFYCALSGATSCDIPVLFFSQFYKHELVRQAHIRRCEISDLDYTLFSDEFAIYRYQKDTALEQMIIDQCIKFWHEHVLARKCPEPTTLEEVDILYANAIEGSRIEATTEIKKQLCQLQATNDDMSMLKKQKEKLQFDIKKFMGSNETLYEELNNRELATCKTHEANRLDTKTFKEEQIDIYNQYTKNSQYKKFTLKGVSA